MKALRLLVLFGFVIGFHLSRAETVKDREEAVRADKDALEKDARWIYNDYQKGFAEARRTGKPLLVVLRCVPCLACAGIDTAVLLQETDLAPLLDQFVCVRVINANALDLSLFQVDYDLSFSTIFFNGDGTVYGRYGSWTHQKNSQDKTTAGYKRALEAALALHRGYPANKASLDGKQGESIAFKTPLDIPGLAGRYKVELDWQGKVVPSCLHCHQIGEGFRVYYWKEEKRIPESLIYPWPAPETIGLTLAPDQIARVQSVVPGSAAAQAGLKPGDDIVAFGAQPLVSIADFSWVLHRSPDQASIPAAVRSAGESSPHSLSLSLPSGWRTKSDISKRVGVWSMRRMVTGGMLLEDLSDHERLQRGLSKDQMALLVKYLADSGPHGAAKRAGFQKNDVLVELAGTSARTTESEVIGRLLSQYQPGDAAKATVLRGTNQIALSLPIQK